MGRRERGDPRRLVETLKRELVGHRPSRDRIGDEVVDPRTHRLVPVENVVRLDVRDHGSTFMLVAVMARLEALYPTRGTAAIDHIFAWVTILALGGGQAFAL